MDLVVPMTRMQTPIISKSGSIPISHEGNSRRTQKMAEKIKQGSSTYSTIDLPI